MSEKRVKLTPMRWRRVAGGYNSDSYALRRDGADIAIVARVRGGGWYSYSMGLPQTWNTSGSPAPLDEAKADAVARARAALESPHV